MNLIVVGVCIGLAAAAIIFAFWKNQCAARANKALNQSMDELPSKVADALRLLVRPNERGSTREPAAEAWIGAINYLDVNQDGQKELLVQHPTGAHGSTLCIFEWKDGKFNQLAELRTDTPVGFEFGDFDGDGKVEIKTEETDWSVGAPYVSAPRTVLLTRWNGSEFKEVSRQTPLARTEN